MSKKRSTVPDLKPEQITPDMVATILEEGVDFEITVKYKGLLHLLRILPTARKFVVYPITLGVLFQISHILQNLDQVEGLSDNTDLFGAGLKSVTDSKDRMIEVVALGILNKKVPKGPTALLYRWKKWRLIKFLDANLTSRDLLRLTGLIISQMDVTDFLACTVSAGRMNMAGTSKQDQSTTGKSSEV